MTRVLFVGDLSPSGFGSVTSDLGAALLARELDVRFLSQNDLTTLPEPYASRTVDLAFWEYSQTDIGATGVRSLIGDICDGTTTALLMNGEPWGDWMPEAIILLGDFFAVRLLDARFGAAFRKVPTFHYCPVEGVDLPPLWGKLWAEIAPVAMSRFGQGEIARITGSIPPLAYHGVDTDTFHPVSPSTPLVVPQHDGVDSPTITLRSREACRVFFGWDPKRRYVLRTDRNMPRKRFGALIRAMQPVLEERPDVTLVLHCRAWDQGGFLLDDQSKLPPAIQHQVIVTDRPGLPRSVLVAMYNAADVYASTSAEGFGLTIAEALACAVPVVGLDYSAVPEVIGPAGITVPVGQLYDNEYSHKWASPQEEDFGTAVGYLLDRPAKARAMGEAGRKHVQASFRWSDAAETFHGLIEARLDAPQARGDSLPPEAEEFTFVPQTAPQRELVHA